MANKNKGWDKIKTQIPDEQKAIHNKLGRVSQHLFKLLGIIEKSELQLVWRAALAHTLNYNGIVPVPLEKLQNEKELEMYEWMRPLIEERVTKEIKQDYSKVSKSPRAIARAPRKMK